MNNANTFEQPTCGAGVPLAGNPSPKAQSVPAEGVAGSASVDEPVQARVAAMRAGNPDSADAAPARDLNLVKGEYWSTRKVPAKPHHFTREEFDAYLSSERFPTNTLADRLQVHVGSVRKALTAGKYVPLEVMNDVAGKEALELAEMDVHAMAEAARQLEHEARAVEEFERAIGYTLAGGNPHNALQAVMVSAAKAQPCTIGVALGISEWVTHSYKKIDLHGHPRAILVALKRGANGKQWVDLHDTGWPPGSLFGIVHQMDYAVADSIFCGAVKRGEVSREQARSVMGPGWVEFISVSVLDSTVTGESVRLAA